LKNYINIIIILLSALAIGCKAPSIQTNKSPSKYGEIDIISIEKNKTERVVLFVTDDDTVSLENQVGFFVPLLGKKTSLFAFPKYHYTNIVEKDNADNPSFRLELLVVAYQNLLANGKIKETQEVIVLGLGEGSLIAPHFSRLVNASRLLLINPMYHSYKENMTIAYTEKTKNAADLKRYLGFAYPNEWLEFFEDVEKGKKPDKSAGTRTYRYFNSYWNYYPGKYIGTQTSTELILFKDYYLSSEYDKNHMSNLKQPNISSKEIEGYMFSKFSESELKKLDLF
jgi:hypothetical protein